MEPKDRPSRMPLREAYKKTRAPLLQIDVSTTEPPPSPKAGMPTSPQPILNTTYEADLEVANTLLLLDSNSPKPPSTSPPSGAEWETPSMLPEEGGKRPPPPPPIRSADDEEGSSEEKEKLFYELSQWRAQNDVLKAEIDYYMTQETSRQTDHNYSMSESAFMDGYLSMDQDQPATTTEAASVSTASTGLMKESGSEMTASAAAESEDAAVISAAAASTDFEDAAAADSFELESAVTAATSASKGRPLQAA